MITQVTIKEGFLTDILGQDRVFNFKPGCNVLFGPNGSGKTSLLRALAGHCLIEGVGWSSYLNPSSFPGTEKENKFTITSKVLAGLSRGVSLETDWDGRPTFLCVQNLSDNHYKGFNADLDGDGVIDGFMMMLNKGSLGEKRLHHLSKMFDKIQKVPDGLLPISHSLSGDQWIADRTKMNNIWAAAWDACDHYLENKPKSGPATYLFDEIDNHLDLVRQCDFWTKMAEIKKQVIVATHSPFALLVPNTETTQIIDMQKGYTEKCRNLNWFMLGNH